MHNNLFTIGQIAKIKGITVKALRFYERIGVIKPAYTDPSTLYRYYSLDQFIQFDVIRALRYIDVSPKDIKGILDKRDTRQLLAYLDDQKETARHKIASLQRTVKMIEQAKITIQGAISTVSNQSIVTREIPERCVLTTTIKEPLNEQETLIQFSEFPLLIEKNNLLDAYETGYVSTPDKNNEFHPAYIYNAVALDKSSNQAHLSTIPAGKYVCLCFSRQNMQAQWLLLTNYLKENIIKPRLILQVELLSDIFDPVNQYCEWQVLV
jgi:DNA-binding transcriptional MerR regulator